MPAPLMHIAIALMALESVLPHVDKKSFILGTSFPDIRYLNVIKREKTHVKSVTWDQILQEKNSFKCGYLFHSFIDELFDNFISQNNVSANLPQIPHALLGFKFFADKIILERIKPQLAGIEDYFNGSTAEELSFGITQKDISRWHNIIKKYCTPLCQCNPSILVEEIPLFPNNAQDIISSALTQMNKPNSLAKKYALDFYDFAAKKIRVHNVQKSLQDQQIHSKK